MSGVPNARNTRSRYHGGAIKAGGQRTNRTANKGRRRIQGVARSGTQPTVSGPEVGEALELYHVFADMYDHRSKRRRARHAKREVTQRMKVLLDDFSHLSRSNSDSSSINTASGDIIRYDNTNGNNFYSVNTDNCNTVDNNMNNDELDPNIDNTHSTDDSNEVLNHFLQNDIEKEIYLLTNLREWAMKGVSFVKVDNLLKILRTLFPNLPKSCKSLLHTPRKTVTVALGNGQFFYKGIRKNIDERLLEQYFADHQEIIIDVNIDGLNPFESTNDCFWPIIGCFEDDPQPFIIAVYFGKGKPCDMETFLGQYVEEVKELQEQEFLLEWFHNLGWMPYT
ncbi:hypothetical protein DBV15_12259 [Temnothorax longispinosus]|uniref:Uncharacterized protein n=1 Tax=Temnothorax longispinosus TaxID=300112 RepID=A0A4S2KP21_9HYME|nr:hypothetical protein DBV15_12259 [Temnothorax longispinosus]